MNEIHARIVAVVDQAVANSLRELPGNVLASPVAVYRRFRNGMFEREYRVANGRYQLVAPLRPVREVDREEFLTGLFFEDTTDSDLNSEPSTFVGL